MGVLSRFSRSSSIGIHGKGPGTGSGSSSGSNLAAQASTAEEQRIKEEAALRNALESAELLMNDDPDGAYSRLHSAEPSAYADLGLLILAFFQASMGLEASLMREATDLARACEKSSLQQWRDASASSYAAPAGAIYPPGSGYAVVNATAQLMSGVTGVLDEASSVERLGAALKAFFKLRRAHATLSNILKVEANMNAVKAHGTGSYASSPENQYSALPSYQPCDLTSRMPGGFFENDDEDEDQDDEAALTVGGEGLIAPSITPGGQALKPVTTPKLCCLDIPSTTDPITANGCQYVAHPASSTYASTASATPSGLSSCYSESPATSALISSVASPLVPAMSTTQLRSCDSSPCTPDGSYILTNPIDIFVRSGANMCLGAVQLILSVVPSAYRPLLSLVGLQADRKLALQMLWRSSTYPNLCGTLAALILLGFYAGMASTSDILPAEHDFDEEAQIIGYPKPRCMALLADVRARYPDSPLWRLVEGRVLADEGRLSEAILLLSSGPEGNVPQITVLTYWELGLTAMCARNWPLMRDSFLRCAKLNDWTQTLYLYCAGAAELEMYRDGVHKGGPAHEVSHHREAAERYFRHATMHAGHRRLLTKRIPHEVFVERRVQRWEERATALGIGLADAIGSSPAQEMVYIWNGGKRMSEELLRLSIGDLDFARCTGPDKNVMASLPEDRAVRAVTSASMLRRLGSAAEARQLLQRDAVGLDRAQFKKQYVIPMAHFEMAVIAWDEASGELGGFSLEVRQQRLEECQAWLNEVTRWGDRYWMDGRFGLRAQLAQTTVKWYRRKMGW